MTSSVLHIHPRVRTTSTGIRCEFDLVRSEDTRHLTLFYEAEGAAPPETFDGVLCAVVMHAMGTRANIRLHGPATRQALRNLAEFQLAWSRWLPDRYEPVAIEADVVVDARPREGERALSAFSGGVDSTFTLLRNRPSADPTTFSLEHVVLVHGFDIALANGDALEELVARTAPSRDLAGVRLQVVRTNSKELGLQSWEDSCGAQLAACLHLYSGTFSHALIGSSDPYDALVFPWGSNPVTDPLLSGGQMTIVNDGSAFCRTAKLAWLATWPAAVEALKVCWEGRYQGRNCGVCEKCVRTRINLLAAGVSTTPGFEAPFDPRDIVRLPIESHMALGELQAIVRYGERRAIDEPWFLALRARVSKGLSPPRRSRRSWRGRMRQSLGRVRLLGAARMVRSKLTILAGG